MIPELTGADYCALMPFLTLFLTALLILFLDTFFASYTRVLSFATATGLLVALIGSCNAFSSTNSLLTAWISFDFLSTFFAILFLSIGLFILAIGEPWFKQYQIGKAEFYFFVVSSLFGLLLISSAKDLLTLFLGLETLSIALYVLCGYVKRWQPSHEAAFKYFLLGSVSTAFLLFGIALVYGAVGSTSLERLASFRADASALFFTGITFVTLSLLFKAAVVPFHMWAPDVYAAAPNPVVAFMAVATKAAAFAALIRLSLSTFTDLTPIWNHLIAILAYPTLIYANFVALKQQQLKRFFAYSGISHAGFVLIGLAAHTPLATNAILSYLIVYSIATLGAFAILALIDESKEGTTIYDLQGLIYSSPCLASIFCISLLTLGGIPPTIGFFAKFSVLKEAFSAGYYGLVVVGLLTSIVSAFYYLRIIAFLFTRKQSKLSVAASITTFTAAATSCIAIITTSFYPELLFTLLAIN